jgi:DNA-binding CsgD family transcriptional regulator
MAFAALGELLTPLSPYLDRLHERQRAALAAILSFGDAGTHSDLEVFVAATALLDAAAQVAPVLCVVDDVHWTDTASMDGLLFASKRLRDKPVGFVFGTRDDLHSRLDASSIPFIRLGPLDAGAAEDLVRSTSPFLPRPRRLDIVRAAEGVPLALIEFASEAVRDPSAVDRRTPLPVSERIERVYGHQARTLPATARTALLVLAASELQHERPVLEAMEQLGCTVADLDAALDSGLVRRNDDRIVFRHPLARSAVYQSAGHAERRAVHRALGAALAETQPELAAWHNGLGSTGPDEEVAAALERTAVAARRRGGRLAEARALELAARLSPAEEHVVARLLAAGTAALQAGRPTMARSLLKEVVNRSSDVLVLADAQHQLAQLDFWQDGRVPENLVDVAGQVEPVDRRRAARLLSFALVPLISDCQVAKALPIARRAWSLIDRRVQPFDVAFRVAHVLVMAGDPDGVALTMEAARAAERENDLIAMIMISQPLWWLEEYQTARRLLATAISSARESDAIWMLCHGLINQAELDRRTGRPVAARNAAAEALILAEEIGDPMQRTEALVQVAVAEAQMGEYVQARAHAEQALRLVQSRSAGATELRLTAAHALARVAVATGRPDEAVNHLQPLVDRVVANGVVDATLVPSVGDLLDAQIAVGRQDDAARLEQWLSESAQRCGRRWVRLAAARAAALRAPETGRDRLAALLDECSEETAAIGETPVMAARAWLTFGEVLRRGGERGRARAALARADHLFHTAGAGSWYPRVAAELRACGVAGQDVAAGLTPQEDRIARLAATGARNREIAQRLHLSEKTVESHLASAFRKLGTRSRTELAARFVSGT